MSGENALDYDLEKPWEGDYQPQATKADIVHAFRLILGRFPHMEEWTGHSALAGKPLVEIVRTYVNSAEFKSRGLLEVSLPSGIVQRHNGLFSVFADENDTELGGPTLTGGYEPHVRMVIEQILKEGDSFLDVGAAYGFFSLLAATLVGAAGQVYAVEPNEQNVKLLESSIRSNGFNNVAVMQMGASDRIETLFLHAGVGNGSTSAVGAQDNPFAARTVLGAPLDQLLVYRSKPIKLIKIDVEGFEHKALLGAQRLIKEDRPSIIFEFQGAGAGAREFLEWLQSLGYALVNISSGRPISDTQEIDEIMSEFSDARVAHLDILAKP